MRLISTHITILAAVLLLLAGATAGFAQTSADLDQSGFVDANDQLLFLHQWQTGGSFAPDVVTPAGQVAVEIIGVNIPPDNRPEVTFTLQNGNGDPINPASLNTYRFIIAKLVVDDPASNRTHYESYTTRSVSNQVGDATPGTVMATQATYDTGNGPQGGVAVNITDNGDGTFTYKFVREVVVAPADQGLTHTVGAQIHYDFEGKRSYANPVFNFVPNGGAVTRVRELTETMTCNSCHTDLAFHGGGRKEVGLCILCHNPAPGNIDPDSGNSIDMTEMIHKIHHGVNRPSGEPYIIYGNQNSVHDYSNILLPQDIRNCDTCHTGSAAHPEQANYWQTHPTRRSCGSCHDDIDFEDGIGHLAMTNDSACSVCHQPTGTGGPATSVQEAHWPVRKNPAFPRLMSEIVEVAGAVAGGTPSVTFTLKQEVNGIISDITPASLNSVAVTLAGPTVADYNTQRRHTVGANAVNNGNGTHTYTLPTALPADAMGTWGFSIEARTAAFPDFENQRATLVANPLYYAALDGGQPELRRAVIDEMKCNACHDQLVLHGANRVSYDLCIFCHKPNGTDIAQRPAGSDPETINMKDMIHKIHRGVGLNEDYTVYGFGGTPHNYNHVVFPGIINRCDMCHLEGTYELPLPDGLASTEIRNSTGEIISSETPAAAACSSCHDSSDAVAHMNSFVALGGGVENCADCHGKGAQWSVETAHFSN